MPWRRLLIGLILATSLGATTTPGVREDVTFQAYTPLSASTELMRRLLSPLNAQRLKQRMAAQRASLREQPIDLAHEHFALYVPPQRPAHGYALLVFVPPWDEARVPAAWLETLAAHGTILVTAAHMGNDADVLDRREPLAVLAATNVMSSYPIDSTRVYVGGFSGGARVALRLALGYPDLFKGALLDAGSDAIGVQVPAPPRELLERFEAESRLVYLTGDEDPARLDADRQSRQSLKDWCVSHLATLDVRHTGHELADATALGRALQILDSPTPSDATALAACRTRLQRDMDTQLDKVEALRSKGAVADARALLTRIDARYGGLAAPRSETLSTALAVSP